MSQWLSAVESILGFQVCYVLLRVEDLVWAQQCFEAGMSAEVFADAILEMRLRKGVLCP